MIDWIALTQSPFVWFAVFCIFVSIFGFVFWDDNPETVTVTVNMATPATLALIPTGLFMSLQHLIAYGRLVDAAEIQAGQICHGWAGLVLILVGLTLTMYLSGKAPPTGADSRTHFPLISRHQATENSPPRFANALSEERACTRQWGLPVVEVTE